MKPITPFGIPIGVNALFWLWVGLARWLYENVFLALGARRVKKRNRFNSKNIAVILSAHNEELTIRACLQSLKKLVNKDQIYLMSDGSVDKTTVRARMEEVHVSVRNPGRGKSQALKYLMERYKLLERYELIFIVDADNRIDENFLKVALPRFNDREVVAFFGKSKTIWSVKWLPDWAHYFVAYRERLNFLLTATYMYGQTSKWFNSTYVIPGSATIYRSRVLKKLDLGTPGIINEDFHLAFQLYKKKLGRVAFDPKAMGNEHHPDNLDDYWRQVRRWNIGFYQTIRLNGLWWSFFWLTLGAFTLEVTLNAVFLMMIPAFLWFNFGNWELSAGLLDLPLFGEIKLWQLLVFMWLADYLMTVLVALIKKRPSWLFYGVFFYLMHFVTAMILFTAIVPGLVRTYDGMWRSPTRRAV